MRAALSAIILLLAGCAGPAEPVSDPGAPAPGAGAISGVVVSEGIVPIADASVTLSAGQEAVTDSEGTFRFDELEPGLHTMRVAAQGYLPIQATAEVVAGDVAKPRIVLPIDASPPPYHLTTAFDGYIELADGWVTWILMDVTGNTEFCTCEFTFPVEGPAQELVLEGFWEPSSPANDPEFWWEIYRPAGSVNADGYSTSPLWQRTGVDWEDGDGLVRFAVGTTIQFQQDYQAFVTVFYNGPAPDGWTIAS